MAFLSFFCFYCSENDQGATVTLGKKAVHNKTAFVTSGRLQYTAIFIRFMMKTKTSNSYLYIITIVLSYCRNSR